MTRHLTIRCAECGKGQRIGEATETAYGVEMTFESTVRVVMPGAGGGSYRLGRSKPFPPRKRVFQRDELAATDLPFECPDDGQVWANGSDVLSALDARKKAVLARHMHPF